MASPAPVYRYRPMLQSGRCDDAQLLLRFFDSALPYLASIGSGAQWGSERFSSRPTSVARIANFIALSDATHAGGVPFAHSDWCKAFVAERRLSRDEAEQPHVRALLDEAGQGQGKRQRQEQEHSDGIWLPFAAMLLCSRPCDYLASIWPGQDDADPFVFLRYLISDHRAGALSKGAAGSLLTLARKEAEALGIRRICGDCWNGNERKLVK